MKLHHIEVTNVLGLPRAEISLTTPVTLIAGGNGVGKSSLRDALALALTGELSRVKLKGEADKLVTHGASEASISVLTEKGTATAKITPAGALKLKLDKLPKPWADTTENPALAVALNPASFAAMTAKERRELLLQASGIFVTKGVALQHLSELGLPEDKLLTLAPLLVTSPQAASDFAATQATQAKGAWRQVTGEVWGSDKAGKWFSKQPDPLPEGSKTAEALTEELKQADSGVDAAKTELDAMNTRMTIARVNGERNAEDIGKASEVDRWQAKLLTDQENLDSVCRQIADLTPKATGRRVGLVHDLAIALQEMHDAAMDFVNSYAPEEVASKTQTIGATALEKYIKEHGPIVTTQADPDAQLKLEELQPVKERCTKVVETTQGLLYAAQAAKGRLEKIKGEVDDDISQADVKRAEDEHAKASASAADLRTQFRKVQEHAAAVQRAEHVNAKAANLHRDVIEWQQIAQELGAGGGLLRNMLAAPVAAINNRLLASSKAIGALMPSINAESMEISATKLTSLHPVPYALLSASEQWRIEAMLAEAVGHLAGVRLLVLDAMDVIQPSERGMWLTWLEGLSKAGELDTAIVLATMHNPPSLTGPLSRVVWMA